MPVEPPDPLAAPRGPRSADKRERTPARPLRASSSHTSKPHSPLLLPTSTASPLIHRLLTHLTCVSLAEDRFGTVQHDIPHVIEALVAFLGAVEEVQGGLRPKSITDVDAAGKGKEKGKEGEGVTLEEAADLDEARAVLGDVGDALKEGLARIMHTFGDKLRARLQELVDYCM
ncbi:hypothetical protein DFH07DRAFT_1032527 [Mycena maculata]|uniref:Uncharacterized protein n=1 Tax=Mycena maculata TaxID=230809 RepID=A0AAD7IXT7_9AGAR|nr:hypothetical protein DFH07DRAFT_1032527 [Mycena maculata]